MFITLSDMIDTSSVPTYGRNDLRFLLLAHTKAKDALNLATDFTHTPVSRLLAHAVKAARFACLLADGQLNDAHRGTAHQELTESLFQLQESDVTPAVHLPLLVAGQRAGSGTSSVLPNDAVAPQCDSSVKLEPDSQPRQASPISLSQESGSCPQMFDGATLGDLVDAAVPLLRQPLMESIREPLLAELQGSLVQALKQPLREELESPILANIRQCYRDRLVILSAELAPRLETHLLNKLQASLLSSEMFTRLEVYLLKMLQKPLMAELVEPLLDNLCPLLLPALQPSLVLQLEAPLLAALKPLILDSLRPIHQSTGRATSTSKCESKNDDAQIVTTPRPDAFTVASGFVHKETGATTARGHSSTKKREFEGEDGGSKTNKSRRVTK